MNDACCSVERGWRCGCSDCAISDPCYTSYQEWTSCLNNDCVSYCTWRYHFGVPREGPEASMGALSTGMRPSAVRSTRGPRPPRGFRSPRPRPPPSPSPAALPAACPPPCAALRPCSLAGVGPPAPMPGGGRGGRTAPFGGGGRYSSRSLRPAGGPAAATASGAMWVEWRADPGAAKAMPPTAGCSPAPAQDRGQGGFKTAPPLLVHDTSGCSSQGFG